MPHTVQESESKRTTFKSLAQGVIASMGLDGIGRGVQAIGDSIGASSLEEFGSRLFDTIESGVYAAPFVLLGLANLAKAETTSALAEGRSIDTKTLSLGQLATFATPALLIDLATQGIESINAVIESHSPAPLIIPFVEVIVVGFASMKNMQAFNVNFPEKTKEPKVRKTRAKSTPITTTKQPPQEPTLPPAVLGIVQSIKSHEEEGLLSKQAAEVLAARAKKAVVISPKE